MRDARTTRGLPPVEVRQPDPSLDEQQPGPLRIGVTLLGATAVVVLVLYGLSRPEPAPQMASVSAVQSGGPAEPQTQGQQEGQQQRSAGNGAAQPATTGQGQNQSQAPDQNQAKAPADQSPQGRGKSARSDSATTGQGSAPSDKAAAPADKAPANGKQ